ncbi:MAG: glutamate--cysteine ligase, partial [Rhodobacteraceae bacterium]|nr:glutamate--cysteine ligase [Paracoccaceae bacterium]
MSIPQSGGGPIERFEQLAEYMESGCKPKDDWRIGTEHEKFGYCKDTLLPLPYDGPRSIRAMLEGLQQRFGWEPVFEQGHIIGLTHDGANVSLEPGGQLELSGAPLETIHQTCDEVNEHLREVQEVADQIGARFIGLGAAPIWTHEQMPLMPKGRYKLMNDYMAKVGTHGTQMMRRTCTVQVNLDFASEADMVKKMRVALALQPVATALFANSPFFEGKPNGMKSWRSRIWRGLDDSRTGMLPFFFEDGMGFQRYVDYVL